MSGPFANVEVDGMDEITLRLTREEADDIWSMLGMVADRTTTEAEASHWSALERKVGQQIKGIAHD